MQCKKNSSNIQFCDIHAEEKTVIKTAEHYSPEKKIKQLQAETPNIYA